MNVINNYAVLVTRRFKIGFNFQKSDNVLLSR